jgi:ketosteroid isomerase-like protein
MKITTSLLLIILGFSADLQAQYGNSNKDLEQLKALNKQFINNYRTSDTAAHSRLIHPDFVCIESSGRIIGRREYLATWGMGPEYVAFDYEDEKIRIFGNMALVRSKNTYTIKTSDKTISGATIYTDTYIKEKGKWSCVQAQITGVRK